MAAAWMYIVFWIAISCTMVRPCPGYAIMFVSYMFGCNVRVDLVQQVHVGQHGLPLPHVPHHVAYESGRDSDADNVSNNKNASRCC
jgi:hypothetical protein